VHRLVGLLLSTFNRHRTDGAMMSRLGNGLGIVEIVLLTPQIPFNVLGR
jgi:hypothetical protein